VGGRVHSAPGGAGAPSVRLVRAAPPSLLFPRHAVTPIRSLLRRAGIAVAIVLFIAVITWVGRSGYVDANGDGISVLDAIYYSTVTVTTTGYGDIYPSSPAARAWTAFAVTPLRILFLIVLVGTTLAVLTERFREAVAQNRWRRRVNDHIIIAGYGTKGRGAADSLLATGAAKDHIVVIDVLAVVIEEARSRGFTGVLGDATRTAALTEALVERAASVIVTCHRDDTATLVTLTARELNPAVRIVAAVKESENAHLLRESGATTVVVSAEASGRLLGLATRQPRAVEVLEDLIVAGEGLELVERPAVPAEVGGPVQAALGQLPVAIVRGGERIAFDDERCRVVQEGDVVVSLTRE
jgi:voltage-gated potassium channel